MNFLKRKYLNQHWLMTQDQKSCNLEEVTAGEGARRPSKTPESGVQEKRVQLQTQGPFAVVAVQSLSHVRLFCDSIDCSLPGSSVRGISQARVPEWVPLPSPGDLSNVGIGPVSPALQEFFLPSEPPGKAICYQAIICSDFFYLFFFSLHKFNEQFPSGKVFFPSSRNVNQLATFYQPVF